jgi:hypothetical protein
MSANGAAQDLIKSAFNSGMEALEIEQSLAAKGKTSIMAVLSGID